MSRVLPVVHSVREWLPQTMTWLYTQVSELPPEVQPHVVCDRVKNLDQFPVDSLHAFEPAAPWRYLWGRALRATNLRPSLHLNLLVEVARATESRVLHSHFGYHGWKVREAAQRAGLAHVVTFYGVDVNYLPVQQPRWRRRYRDLFDGASMVLCEGSHMAQCVVELGCPAEKVRVHHLGVRLDRIPFRPTPWQPGEPLRVLMAASFHEKKGLPYAMQALGRLRQRVEVPLEVTLIGDASSQAHSREEKARILQAMDDHALHDVVQMLGFQPYDRLLEEAYRHHLFLSPSVTAESGDTEGGAPVTLIEMAALGTLVVSTTHCDIPEVVRDGETGLLAPERDVAALVEHMAWLLDHPEAWAPMMEAARRHVEAEYSAAVQGERLARLYSEVAG